MSSPNFINPIVCTELADRSSHATSSQKIISISVESHVISKDRSRLYTSLYMSKSNSLTATHTPPSLFVVMLSIFIDQLCSKGHTLIFYTDPQQRSFPVNAYLLKKNNYLLTVGVKWPFNMKTWTIKPSIVHTSELHFIAFNLPTAAQSMDTLIPTYIATS